MLDALFGEAFSDPPRVCAVCSKLHTTGNSNRSGLGLSLRYNLAMLRLMCVTAHPDDEAGNFGGSLLKYHFAKVETAVVCLTPGQAGSHRGGARSDLELAEVRKQEFRAACEILKVTHPVIYDYPDGQLYLQDLNRVVYALTLEIRRFRPQVLLTFGADGGLTGHPDHGMAGVFASLAFQWAGRSNRYADQFSAQIQPHRTQKLYYGTADFLIPSRQPVALPPPTAAIDIQEHLQGKLSAFRAHASQAPLFPLFEKNALKGSGKELFHLVATIEGGSVHPETDLFEGVDAGDSLKT